MNQLLSLSGEMAIDYVFLIDVALKSCLCLLVTLIATCLLRKRSATMLHGMWTVGFVVCLAIPIIALAVPRWNLPILPQSLGTSLIYPGRSIAQSPSDWNADQKQSGGSGTSAKQPTGHDGATDVARQVSFVGAVSNAHQSPAAEFAVSGRPLWMAAVCAVWIAGAAFFLTRTGWRAICLRRTLHRCRNIDNAHWHRDVRDAARELAFTGNVRLRAHDDAEIPIVTGIVRTILALPNDAEGWPPARRRLVLLHELAHAKRHDVLTQTIAAIATALYWFNPIGWWGRAQMQKLRELACDDMVIASGQPPADYAAVLLDVVRSYRHRSLAAAIGMARGNHVENRITAILDKGRSRIAMSRRVVGTLIATAATIALVLGSMRLQSQADDSPAPPATAAQEPAKKLNPSSGEHRDAAQTAKGVPPVATKPPATADPDARTIVVRVTDNSGAPLANTKLHVSIWEFDGGRKKYGNRDYTTNAEGDATVQRPTRLKILRMWPYKAGYVPLFVNFSEGTHDDGKLIPERYDFKLERGTTLSGTVLDENGRPIPGVTVDVSVTTREPAWGSNPKPMISHWLTDEDFNDGPVLTDKGGKWSIHNAPAPVEGNDSEFRLKFTHKDYISDSEWGELQKEQNVTTDALRNGSARIVLKDGIAVTGIVVDPSGKPVPKGLVIWSDDPYLAEGVNEAPLDGTGHFKTLTLRPGERSLTVLAPGFSPERWTVNMDKGMRELQFALQPGKRLTFKVVDENGKSIPEAYVDIDEWRGTKSIYNEDHPNVPDSHVPRQADKSGVYRWDWAPDDAVTYRVSAKGFKMTTVTLVAKPAEQIVELKMNKKSSKRRSSSQ